MHNDNVSPHHWLQTPAVSNGRRLQRFRFEQTFCRIRIVHAQPLNWLPQVRRAARITRVQNPGVALCFFFLERTFSVSCRVPILAKARSRSRVRAGSAQRQAARPVWVGEVKDFIQGRRIGVCWSRHGPPRQFSPTLAQPVGLGACGGRLGVGPASLRQHSTGHPLRIRARRGFVRHLSRAQARGGMLARVSGAQNSSILGGRAGVGLTIACERRNEGRITAWRTTQRGRGVKKTK